MGDTSCRAMLVKSRIGAMLRWDELGQQQLGTSDPPLVNIKRFDLDEEAAAEAWTMPAAS